MSGMGAAARLDAEVIVVGAGPAGCAFASQAADHGVDVLMLDQARFPRPKPCGEFVNPGAVEVLGRLGFLEAVEALGPARIDRWSIGDGRAPPARGRYDLGDGVGFGISRQAFDHALLIETTARGARALEGCRVRSVEIDSWGRPRIDVIEERGHTKSLSARIVVGADGLRSTVARRLSLQARAPLLRKVSLTCHLRGRGPDPRCGQMRTGGEWTVGMAALDSSGSLWNATVVVDSARQGRSLAIDPLGFYRRMLDRAAFEWEGEVQVVAGPWSSGPFDWPMRQVAGRGFALIGDAAGYFDPLTGQGIRRALRSGELAASAILEALRSPGAVEPRGYSRALKREFGASRALQHVIEAVLSRERPRRWIFDRLGGIEDGLTPLLRVTGDLRPVRSLAAPRAWWPLVRGHRVR